MTLDASAPDPSQLDHFTGRLTLRYRTCDSKRGLLGPLVAYRIQIWTIFCHSSTQVESFSTIPQHIMVQLVEQYAAITKIIRAKQVLALNLFLRLNKVKLFNRINTVKCISFTPTLNSCGLPCPFYPDRIFVIDLMFSISFFFLIFLSNISLP